MHLSPNFKFFLGVAVAFVAAVFLLGCSGCVQLPPAEPETTPALFQAAIDACKGHGGLQYVRHNNLLVEPIKARYGDTHVIAKCAYVDVAFDFTQPGMPR